jgi:hypothetical protein
MNPLEPASAKSTIQILYTADSADAATWTNISAPLTRTGFETEIDISSANRSSLVRAKAVNRDGKTLGWTDAADGNGGHFQGPDLDDSQITTTDAPSSATGVATSSTISVTSTRSLDTPTSSSQAGGASTAEKSASLVFQVLAAGIVCAQILSI